MLKVQEQLMYDFVNYGGCRYLVTDNTEEFSIQRIAPEAIVSVEIDDDED